MNRLCCVILGICLLWVAPAALRAQEPAPAANAAFHYLIVIDTSFSMARLAPGVRKTVFDAVFSGIYGQMKPGERFAVWTFNEKVYVNRFPVQTWSPDFNRAVALNTVELLKKQPYEKSAKLDDVVNDLLKLIRTQRDLKIILLSDGSDVIVGTPFDRKINLFYGRHYDEFRKQGVPFVTTFVARDSELQAWSINAGDDRIFIPPLDTAKVAKTTPAETAKPKATPEATTPKPTPSPEKSAVTPTPLPPTVTPVVKPPNTPDPTTPVKPTVVKLEPAKPTVSPEPATQKPTPAATPPPAPGKPAVLETKPSPAPPKVEPKPEPPPVVKPTEIAAVPRPPAPPTAKPATPPADTVPDALKPVAAATTAPPVRPVPAPVAPDTIPSLPPASISTVTTTKPAPPEETAPPPKPAPEIVNAKPAIATPVPEPAAKAPEPGPEKKETPTLAVTIPPRPPDASNWSFLAAGIGLLAVAGGLAWFMLTNKPRKTQPSLISKTIKRGPK